MFQNRFRLNWPNEVLEFGGGGGGPSQADLEAQKKEQARQQKAMERMMAQMNKPIRMPEFNIPAPPPPVPISPAPTQSSADIEAAQLEAKRQSAGRYGYLRTTYAGSTGGYMGSPLGSSNSGGATKLG